MKLPVPLPLSQGKVRCFLIIGSMPAKIEDASLQQMTISQGAKLSIATQWKRGGALGGKLGIGKVAEVSASLSAERSETLAYEISASSEWSYSSRPCQFCEPRVHFPGARVQVISRFSRYVPFFLSRRA